MDMTASCQDKNFQMLTAKALTDVLRKYNEGSLGRAVMSGLQE